MKQIPPTNGFLVPPLKPKGRTTFLSTWFGNLVIRRLNALLNLKVQEGAQYDFKISDANAILTIKRQIESSSTTGSSLTVYKVTSISNLSSNYIAGKTVAFDASNTQTLGASAENIAIPWALRNAQVTNRVPEYAVDDYILVTSCADGTGVVVSSAQLTLQDIGIGRTNAKLTYRGLYSTGSNYAINDVVYSSPVPGIIMTWVAAIASTSGSPQSPAWPHPGTIYWRLLASSGQGVFRYKSSSANYITCRTWDGTTEGGTDIAIAKAPELRSPSSETIDGVSVTYSSYSGAVERVASDGSYNETQKIIPRLVADTTIIYASPTEVTIAGGGGGTWYWLADAQGRAWTRIQ